MYRTHPTFIIKKSIGQPIWRYMDFWKFLNLLETKSLWFSNAIGLGDNHEGVIPHFVLSQMLEQDKQKGNTSNEDLNNYLEKNLRFETLISSWRYAERESFAMWKMYSKDKTGIAIKTDFESLKKSFDKTERDIYIGEILYIDENNYYYTTSNMYFPFLTKLDYYSFENEIRCITSCGIDEEKCSKLIEVDINILIKEVFISPNTKPEFKKLLELLRREYYLNYEIKFSEVNDSWL
ncbi:hypothetical protein QF023_003653 [Chryseobacterium sp. SLBN-27]|uniref:DUF2971 domain-containing protein n=1 Tax=Chryseobacterium sp. SLBN-27 TaxID=3042287 RepID=UPI0028630AE6|nr:DUF2971 domain-containing protein [Chryseobacterium sp. SLBN-27]MDR6160137.1 hypothetical protein [Chryseobacterium sp. SLBN-27]